MDRKSDPAKTTKNRPRHATHENTKNSTKSERECEFDHPKTQKHYKTPKKVTKKSPKTAKRSKMSRTQVLLKNRSKSVIREHTLHTCTREKRFSKAKFEKTILNRDRMKKWHIWGEISIFVRVLQCFSKVLQNPSEKLKMTNPRAQFRLWVDVYSGVRCVRNKMCYKSADFWARVCRARRDPLEKNRGQENTCARDPRESTI